MTRGLADRNYTRAAWLLISGFAVFRLIYAGAFPLVPDETNYWQWSRHLAWGYHDQAPMIAWAIKLFTSLLGHTEMAVRLPSILAMTVASAYLAAIAGRWSSPAAAFYTALLSQGVLFFNVGGLLATADGLQAAGWAAASYHVARAYEEDSWSQWLISGFCFGCGLLSKYTMVIFLPCAFGYGLFTAGHRSRLAGIRPYLGVLLGSLMFMPVIYWNAVNGWKSVRHVAYLGGANDSFALHFNYLAEYLGSQAGLLSPLVFILILMAWQQAVKKENRAANWLYSYLVFTSLPMVAGFALLSLHTRVYGNWPGAGYLTACVLAAALFTDKAAIINDRARRFRQRLWPWAIGTAYLLTALVLLQVVRPLLPLPTGLDRTSTEIYGWQELGRKADETFKSMPRTDRTFLFGLKYQIASELAFYAPGQPQTVSINKWQRPNVYDYWWEDADLLGWDAVGVTYHAEDLPQLREIFERVEEPVRFEVFRERPFMPAESAKPVQVFYIFRAYGFKGGLRWVPADKSDIRAG